MKNHTSIGKKSRWTAKTITTMGLLAALMSVSAWIAIPLPFSTVSLTAQTMMFNLVGMILGPLETAAVFLVWILVGAAGLPVFSGGMGGLAKLFGPTGGYIVGALTAGVLISLFCRKVGNLKAQTAFLIFVGIPVIDGLGAVWMKVLLPSQPWSLIFMEAIAPFIPMDIVKCFGAAALARALRPALKQDF